MAKIAFVALVFQFVLFVAYWYISAKVPWKKDPKNTGGQFFYISLGLLLTFFYYLSKT